MIENPRENLSAGVKGDSFSGEVKCQPRHTGEGGVNHVKIRGKQKSETKNRLRVLSGTTLGLRKRSGN